MLSQYGVQSKPNVAAGAVVSPVNDKEYDIALSPLFLVRTGGVYPTYAVPFQNAGYSGNYWSSQTYSSTANAYRLGFSTSVNPSNSSASRYNGFSLRCLIPTP